MSFFTLLVCSVWALPPTTADLRQWPPTTDAPAHIAPGEPHLLRDDLNVGVAGSGSTSVTHLAHLSDTHVFDEETPARQYWAGWLVPTIFHYQEAHTTQVLDAAVQTVNQLHRSDQLDFAVLTGDLINNRQANELDWLVTTLEGGAVHPDSGADDNPLAGLDPHDPFVAEGLAIPWYATLGNHDRLFEGHMATDAWIGSPTRDRARFAVEATCVETEMPVRCGVAHPTAAFTAIPRAIVADPARRGVSATEVMNAMSGHGFTDGGPGYWSVKPAPKVRLIGLDTSSDDGLTGRLDEVQLAFVEAELTLADDLGEVAIITSHHPSTGLGKWGPRLRRVLHRHDAVILHLAGHRHTHSVMPRPGGGHGYWEVLTASLLDWPQQFRLVEVVDTGNGVGEIRLTVVDVATTSSVVADAKTYALHTSESGPTLFPVSGEGRAKDRNVVLRVSLGDGFSM